MQKFIIKQIPLVYLYDGTFNGLLTIVFDCYIYKTIPIKILPTNLYIPNILDTTKIITTNYEKSERIFNGIVKNISYDTLYNSYYAFLAENKNKEINIVKYLIYGFCVGPKIDSMLSVDFVFNVHSLRKKMLSEAHKLKGLLRFSNIGNNLFYASLHPTNNVIENIGHHFIKRLPMQNFIIHDKNRNIAFLYNTKEYQIIDASNLEISQISAEEKLYQNLWKSFFNTISIKERKNLKLQMQFMPKKYWKDILEKNSKEN